MSSVLRIKYAGCRKAGKLAFQLALLWNVDQEQFVLQEIMWPSVLVLQDCSLVIHMEVPKDVRKSIA